MPVSANASTDGLEKFGSVAEVAVIIGVVSANRYATTKTTTKAPKASKTFRTFLGLNKKYIRGKITAKKAAIPSKIIAQLM